jgi:plastocyanin
MRATAVLIMGLVVAGLGACSDETSDPAAQVVDIDTFVFTPDVVEVGVGDTVRWTNGDDILHTVTSGTREYDPTNSGLVTATHEDGEFDLELDGRGAAVEHTFTEPGTYHYFCDRHPGMEADVEVS